MAQFDLSNSTWTEIATGNCQVQNSSGSNILIAQSATAPTSNEGALTISAGDDIYPFFPLSTDKVYAKLTGNRTSGLINVLDVEV